MKKLLILVLSIFTAFNCFAAGNLVHKETIPANLKNLNINLLSENLSIKEIYGDEITIEIYSNYKKYIPSIETENNALNIQSVNKSFRFGEYCNVEICIPQDKKFNTIKIKQSSGTLEIEKLYANNIILESTSGSLSADNLRADYELKIEKSSGSTKINKLASDELSISSTSGSVKIESINTIDSNFNLTSGSIKIGKLDTESFDLESTSGSSNISSITADYFTVRSTSGSVTLEFENAPIATSKITASSGSVKLYFLSKDGFDLTFASSSGSFYDGINGSRVSPRGNYETKFYNGGANLIVKTASGSLSIDD